MDERDAMDYAINCANVVKGRTEQQEVSTKKESSRAESMHKRIICKRTFVK